MTLHKSATGRLAGLFLIAAYLGGTVASAADAPRPAANDEQVKTAQEKLRDAQGQLEEAVREVAELNLRNGTMLQDLPRVFQFRAPDLNRAMLGINIAGTGRDNPATTPASEGVPVVSVSPGGPAAAVGIQAGDVILALNGEKLVREGNRSAQDQLLALMRDIAPNSTVRLEYRRDGRMATADVVAQPLFAAGALRTLPSLAGIPGVPELPEFGAGFNVLTVAPQVGAMELVALTPKLGQYFGTDTGLLVVKAPGDSRFKLEEGDVILGIAGRTPTSPSHALRILGSYQPGETLALQIMRQRKRTELSIEVPRDRNVQFKADGAPL